MVRITKSKFRTILGEEGSTSQDSSPSIMGESGRAHLALQLMPKFSGSPDMFAEWKRSATTILATASDRRLYRIIKGEAEQRDTTSADGTLRQAWQQSNSDLYFILEYACKGTAKSCVRRFESSDEGRPNGCAAWNGLCEKYEHAGEHRLHLLSRKSATLKMAAGTDPDDFLAEVERLRTELGDLGETVSDNRVWEIIMDALPTSYDHIREAAILNDKFSLDQLKSSMRRTYAHQVRSVRQESDTVTAMSASKSSFTRTKGRCHLCRQSGHYQRECPRRQELSTKKVPKSKKWCSFHKSTTHSDKECRAQQANTANATVAATSSETMTKTPAEPMTTAELGPASYVFMAMHPAQAEMIKLPFMIDSGASNHFVDPDLLAPNCKIAQYTEYDPPVDIVGAGSVVLKGTGHGTLRGFIHDESGQQQRADIHVLLVPGLGKHLFSQVVASKQGMTTVIGPKGGKIHVSGRPSIALRADSECNLLFMDFETPRARKGSSPRFAHAF